VRAVARLAGFRLPLKLHDAVIQRREPKTATVAPGPNVHSPARQRGKPTGLEAVSLRLLKRGGRQLLGRPCGSWILRDDLMATASELTQTTLPPVVSGLFNPGSDIWRPRCVVEGPGEC